MNVADGESVSDGDARALVDAVARRSYGKLVALLAARTRDLAAAEDALGEAFASALLDWPRTGSPANPEAWLLTAARRKAIDAARRTQTGDAALDHLQRLAAELGDAADTGAVPDRRLALMFACAHPAIDAGIRAPLMLQVIVGLEAKAIASAFLTTPAAMSKRLVRAKQKIRDACIPFRIPEREELAGRLEAVLDAIYAAFGEGWTDPAGTDAARRELTGESLFLARLVTELLPDEAEALGLLALLLHTDARRRTRRNEAGEYVPFAIQDSSRWEWDRIREAEALLRRAAALGTPGRFQLQAAVQSAHIYRRHTGEANWGEIVQLYDALVALTGSPVAAVNRAVAVAELHGATVALEALDRIAADPRLEDYQPWWAARAELFARIGVHDEARRAYRRAISLERDPALRRFLERREALLPAR